MNHLYDNYSVQENAIACLQHLTLNNFASKIHPSILSEVMEAILNAMERFPKYSTLNEMILSIIYHNDILLVCILFFY